MSTTSLNNIRDMKKRSDKFVCITSYDAVFAGICSRAGMDILLVGDSLGMVLQGHDSTLPVTMDDMLYHVACVKRGNEGALLMADLPFMSYASALQTLENAAALMRTGAQMIKLEGGAWIAESTRQLSERGIPVCAHMGMTPQSVNRIGGFRVQGRDPEQANTMIDEARLLQAAGASMLLLECVPVDLAQRITASLDIPVIGIGAGPHVDGQIMVLHDVLGISPITPKFVRDFLPDSTEGIPGAISAYITAVREGAFPAPEHCYN